MDCFRLRSLSFGGHVVALLLAMTMKTRFHHPAAQNAPGCCIVVALESLRAQGRPGADCTHGPRATKKHGGRTTGETGATPAFPARVVYGLSRALLGVPGFLATVPPGS